jgi:hypothetical protein
LITLGQPLLHSGRRVTGSEEIRRDRKMSLIVASMFPLQCPRLLKRNLINHWTEIGNVRIAGTFEDLILGNPGGW